MIWIIVNFIMAIWNLFLAKTAYENGDYLWSYLSTFVSGFSFAVVVMLVIKQFMA